MARFLVAFDRCIRRRLVRGVVEQIRSLAASQIPRKGNELTDYDAKCGNYFRWRLASISGGASWRYFRELSYKQPERYLPAVFEALLLYTDEDVRDGLVLLDNWSLIQIVRCNGSSAQGIHQPRVSGPAMKRAENERMPAIATYLMASNPPVRETGHVLRKSPGDLRISRERRYFSGDSGRLSQQTRWNSGA